MKKGFLEEDILLSVPKTGDIRTTKTELTYFSDKKKCVIVVPKNFKTDLGSIPLVLQNIFPKDGKATFGYILHDYLYQTGIYNRTDSDDILKEAMESLDVAKWRQNSVRIGLRLGGWVAWNKHRKGKMKK